MAIKDFYKNFTLVENQYLSAVSILREKQEELEGEMVDPDIITELKEIISPITSSYECINFMRFLLKKHKSAFDKEFFSIKEQYKELEDNLLDAEKSLEVGEVTKEVVDQMKEVIKGTEDKYNIWNYFAYIINAPNKKEQLRRYKKQIGSTLKDLGVFDKLLTRNEEALKVLKEYWFMFLDRYLTEDEEELVDVEEESEDDADDFIEDEATDAEELLELLGIDKKGTYSDDNTYTVELSNSNDFGRVSSILDNSDLLEPIDESSYLTPDNGSLDYKYNDTFLVSLVADFENDYYTLVITNME